MPVTITSNEHYLEVRKEMMKKHYSETTAEPEPDTPPTEPEPEPNSDDDNGEAS